MGPAAILNILLTANTTQANAALLKTQAQLEGTGKTAAATGATVKKAMLGIGLAAGAAGVALYKVGEEFDDAYDKIRVRTGATGKQLDKLEGSFRKVVADVPATFDDASTAVADFNSRLGLTGKPLEKMSKQVTELSRITGTDVRGNVEDVSKAFVDWDVKTKQMGKTLDGFYRVSQRSGATVGELTEAVQRFGSPLRQLGFTLDEAASMWATFVRAGVNTQTMVPGLKLAIANLVQPTDELGAKMEALGVSVGKPDKALRQILDLLGSNSTLTQIEKTSLAMDVFGKRAGADMAEAIKQGRFEIDDMLDTFNKGSDTIRQSGRDTMDLAEQWQQFTNLLKLKLEPVASEVFKGLGDLMKEVTRTFKREGFEGVLQLLTDKLNEAVPKVADIGAKLGLAIIKGIAGAFWHSDILGKLFIGAGAIRLFGGPGVFGKLGVAIFTRIFGSSAATSAATTAASSTVGTALNGAGPASKIGGKTLGRLAGAGIVLGLALEAPAIAEQVQKIVGGVPLQDTNRESFAAKIEEYFGADEGSAKFLGRFKVKLQTEVGNLIFDSRTQKVVAAKGKQLKSAVGETYGQAFQVVANAKREIPFDALVQGFAKVGQKARSTKKPIADYFNELVGDFKLANRGVSTHQTTLSRAMSAISGDLGAGKSDLQGYISGLSQSFGKGKDKTKDFRDSTGGNITGLSNIFGSAVGAIITNLNNSLGKLGAGSSKINWKAVSADPNGRSLGRQRGGLVPGFAKGAIVPGSGSGDTVPLHLGGQLAAWVEPGEYVSVANRKATAALMARNKEIPRFAEGGLLGAHASVSNFVSGLISRFGGSASSGLRPGDSDSLHSTGQAIDYVPGNWPAAAAAVNRAGASLLEGIYNPAAHDGPAVSWDSGSQVPSSFWGAATWAGHMDHIHIAIADGAKVMAQSVAALKKVMIDGPDGPIKNLAQAGVDMARKAASTYLQKHMPTQGPESASYVSGGDGSVPIQIGKILTRQGFDRAAASGIIGNAYRESLWNPASVGTGGGGLWGFTTSPISLADLQNFARGHRKPWTDVGIQTQFMLEHGGLGMRGALNALTTPEQAAALFMTDWERPGVPALDERQAAARRAFNMKGWQRGGIVAKLQKGGFLDPFIDRIYNAKATKKQSVQEIRKLTAKAAKHKIAKLATQGLSFDKNSEIAGKLAKLREQADTFGEYASNASNGTFRGKTEAEWTTMELDALWAFRQTLAKVEEKVKERREQAEKIAKRAQKLLKQWDDKLASAKDRLAREGETPKGWKGDDPSKVSVEKWNKLGGGKRLATMRKFLAAGGKLPGDRKFLEDGSIATPDSQPDMFPNTKGMSAVSSLLKGTVIPGLVGSGGVIAALSGDIKELASRFDTVQGKGLTHRFLDGLPEFGSADALGGEIFTAQQRLAELGKSTTSDANPLDITGIRDIVEAARYGTFDYQLDPTFAGMFAKGGAIPSGKWGIAGEAGPEIIHGPATVTPAAGGVSIENNVYLDGLDLIIDTRIDGKLAKHERKAWLAEKAGR